MGSSENKDVCFVRIPRFLVSIVSDHATLSALISIAGMSNDHTDAATITPEAKPNSDFCSRMDISSFIKNTKAEPSIVPNSGIRSPMIIVIIFVIICSL